MFGCCGWGGGWRCSHCSGLTSSSLSEVAFESLEVKGGEKAVVVCPNTADHSWHDALLRWLRIRVRLLHGVTINSSLHKVFEGDRLWFIHESVPVVGWTKARREKASVKQVTTRLWIHMYRLNMRVTLCFSETLNTPSWTCQSKSVRIGTVLQHESEARDDQPF